MNANTIRYNFFIINNKERFQIKISNETNTNIKYQKLLVFKINHVLNFNGHITSLWQKAS